MAKLDLSSGRKYVLTKLDFSPERKALMLERLEEMKESDAIMDSLLQPADTSVGEKLVLMYATNLKEC